MKTEASKFEHKTEIKLLIMETKHQGSASRDVFRHVQLDTTNLSGPKCISKMACWVVFCWAKWNLSLRLRLHNSSLFRLKFHLILNLIYFLCVKFRCHIMLLGNRGTWTTQSAYTLSQNFIFWITAKNESILINFGAQNPEKNSTLENCKLAQLTRIILFIFAELLKT